MLSDVTVLDCSERIGWLAGRLLADLGADVVRIETGNPNRDDPDWQAMQVNKRCLAVSLRDAVESGLFDRLAAGADILIDTEQPPVPVASTFDTRRLGQLNGGLIHVRVSPFGNSGPKSSWRASDLEIMASGGAMSLAGEPGGEPMRISYPQSPGWAGAHAAAGALTALFARNQSGRGQFVDVSAQRSILAALAHAPTFVDLLGTCPTRCGAFMTGRTVTGGTYRAFWPCADGHLNFTLYGGPAGRRTGRQLVDWMQERGSDPGPLANIDWSGFDPKALTQIEIDQCEAPILAFFRTLTKSEFLKQASRREMLGYPVSDVSDIIADPQLSARGFWQDIAGRDGSLSRHCAPFVMVDGKRPPIRFSFDAELSAEEATQLFDCRRPLPVSTVKPTDRGALAGLKIVEFGGYAAGPHIGKLLANFGASVVHVESRTRPDGFRLEYPPFKDNEPGVDRGGCFTYFNDSKYGITLDLKNEPGLQLAKELAGWADVIVENMRPGVMARLGLGYDDLKTTNPRLIMLSTCNMGQTGPRANTPGFGSQLSAHAGFCGLTGETDGLPMLLYGPYIDFVSSVMGSAAVLAGLEFRKRTGKGALVDQSQFESGLHFISGALLDFSQTGRVAVRRGNRDPIAAPHGAYRCKNDTWIALSCWSDAEFGRLCVALGASGLAADSKFQCAQARQDNRLELNTAINQLTENLDCSALMNGLQSVGIHAHIVNTIVDLYNDEQLAHDRAWRRRPHPVIGDQTYCFPGFDLSLTPGDIVRAGPALGADNETVFCEMLGKSREEIEMLRTNGAFD